MVAHPLHAAEFPNVAVMVRQFLGCPASLPRPRPLTASVERLFSRVGIAFSAKRKSSEAGTLESIMFSLPLKPTLVLRYL